MVIQPVTFTPVSTIQTVSISTAETSTISSPIPISVADGTTHPSLRHLEEKGYMIELINVQRAKVGAEPLILGDNATAQLHAEGPQVQTPTHNSVPVRVGIGAGTRGAASRRGTLDRHTGWRIPTESRCPPPYSPVCAALFALTGVPSIQLGLMGGKAYTGPPTPLIRASAGFPPPACCLRFS